MSSDFEADLDDLRWHWGEAYLIHHLGPDVWVAQRRDSHATISACTSAALLDRIRMDYAAHPVSRAVPSVPPQRDCRFQPEG